jgi:hypothetical protein
MNKEKFTQASKWVGQKWQALTRSIPQLDDIGHVRTHLDKSCRNAAFFTPSDIELNALNDATAELTKALEAHDISLDMWSFAFKRSGDTAVIEWHKRPCERPIPIGDKSIADIERAETKLANLFLKTIGTAFPEKNCNINLLTRPHGGGMHQEINYDRAAIFPLAPQQHLTTLFPGLAGNNCAPEKSIIINNDKFWHAGHAERPFLVMNHDMPK